METEQLVGELRAALSWQLAKPASNPAYQALLDIKREKDPTFINPLGCTDERYKHLFVLTPARTCKHCKISIKLKDGRWLSDALLEPQYCWIDPVAGSQLHEV